MYENPQVNTKRRHASERTIRSHTDVRVRRRLHGRPKAAPMNRTLVRLLICAVIFSAISLIKTFYPQSSDAIRAVIAEKINPGIDYKAAVEAFGRAINGKGNIAEVFRGFTPSQAQQPAQTASADTGGTASASPVAESSPLQSPQPAEAQAQAQPTSAESEISLKAEQVLSLPSRAGQASEEQTKNGNTVDALSFDLSKEDLSDDTLPSAFVLPLPDKVDTQKKEIAFPVTTPVFGRVSSEFGYRDHPIDGDTKFHYGVDIAASNGTGILCFADGVVESTGFSSIYGNYVRVLHKNGFLSFYGHCSKVLVKSGQSVKLGGKIALVGGTGHASGPHLHFEVRLGDAILNPMHYVNPTAKS